MQVKGICQIAKTAKIVSLVILSILITCLIILVYFQHKFQKICMAVPEFGVEAPENQFLDSSSPDSLPAVSGKAVGIRIRCITCLILLVYFQQKSQKMYVAVPRCGVDTPENQFLCPSNPNAIPAIRSKAVGTRIQTQK